MPPAMKAASPRGGKRAGAGRKTNSPSGETMKPRQVRMTDEQWADLKLVTPEAARRLITKEARRLRELQQRCGKPGELREAMRAYVASMEYERDMRALGPIQPRRCS